MAKKSHQEGVQLQENVQLMSQFQVLAARLLELTSVELEDRVRAELHENPALDEDLHRQSEQEMPSVHKQQFFRPLLKERLKGQAQKIS